jgi:hypothetical protein
MAMSDKQEPEMSPLSRTVHCGGQELYIDIYKDSEGKWALAVTNEQGVTSHWTKQFRSDRSALRAAMKTIREEGLEGFHMEQPYKHELH